MIRYLPIRLSFWFVLFGVIVSLPAAHGQQRDDWLLNSASFKAQVQVSADARQVELNNGLIRRVIRLQPNAATVQFDNLMTGESLLRGVKPEALVELDGQKFPVGGLVGQPNYAFLRPEWIDQLKADPAAFRFVGFEIGQPLERLAWKQVRHHAPNLIWPPKGASLRLDFAMAPTTEASAPDIRISVHYEIYDGLPCYSKWITLTNQSDKSVRVDRFSSEVLAVVERSSEVDELSDGRKPPNIHVETDMSFGGMMAAGANRRSFRWLTDPDYATQVNYERKTPCLLDVGPDLGPAESVAPGGRFESFRTWIMPFDSTDRERCGLSVRRLYRTIAPWVTENPLMMHLVSSKGAAVTNAIEQCASVGFEMLILSFGSGFDMENEKPETLEKARLWASFAHSKGIEIGSYSLLASRSVSKSNDVVMLPGEKPVFGNSPCLQSQWGTNYFRRLYDFHSESGFSLLEHDGSYPGDYCASEQHPGHSGLSDSRWTQWREISRFYKWCRGQGCYLNVPDYYFLSGSTKSAMGYRESNWSLPRAEQVIHTRQNIFDGTWEKLPSMGWMFVPLTEYQGGGAAATIEPLEQHLDHYRRMLQSNLALGVQACYRGPRLFDSDQTREMVKQQVDWYKAHRDILESDLIHGRRADARDLDWMLHVNPALKEKGLLAVFNPGDQDRAGTLNVNFYYTGAKDSVHVYGEDHHSKQFKLRRDYSIDLPVQVPAQGMAWFVIE